MVSPEDPGITVAAPIRLMNSLVIYSIAQYEMVLTVIFVNTPQCTLSSGEAEIAVASDKVSALYLSTEIPSEFGPESMISPIYMMYSLAE